MDQIRLLRADEIEARIQSCSEKGAVILLYKNARCDMNILDETFGWENWQRKHELIGGRLFCSVGIRVDFQDGEEWIWKQDVGTESNMEKEKGQASDSFKRACFNIGIGRELYTAPFMFIGAADLKTLKQNSAGKWFCYDHFCVKTIEYEGRSISYVAIKNTNTHKVLEFGNRVTGSPAKNNSGIYASQTQITSLKNLINKSKYDEEQVLKEVGIKSFDKLTAEAYNAIARYVLGDR